MKNYNLLLIFVIVIIFFSAVNVFVTFIKISNFQQELTGYSSLGYVNLTIFTSTSINVSRDTINWSSGVIYNNEFNATLYTSGDNEGIVERGNWSGDNAQGIVVENIGAINISLTLKTDKNAHDFFNSSSNSNEQYMWNVTDKEAGSCNGGADLGSWVNVNKTSGGTLYCSQFDYNDGRDEVYLDILLTVPYDGRNLGFLSDTITITGDVAD